MPLRISINHTIFVTHSQRSLIAVAVIVVVVVVILVDSLFVCYSSVTENGPSLFIPHNSQNACVKLLSFAVQ